MKDSEIVNMLGVTFMTIGCIAVVINICITRCLPKVRSICSSKVARVHQMTINSSCAHQSDEICAQEL